MSNTGVYLRYFIAFCRICQGIVNASMVLAAKSASPPWGNIKFGLRKSSFRTSRSKFLAKRTWLN